MSACVPLYGWAVIAQVQVDEDDLPLIEDHAWCVHVRHPKSREPKYASAVITGKRVLLHRFLLGVDGVPDFEVDHINGDTLDNRRENLRILEPGQNAQNVHVGWGISAHRGVTFEKRAGRWKAYCNLDGRRIHLGLYSREIDAARAAAQFRAAHMPFAVEDPALLEPAA